VFTASEPLAAVAATLKVSAVATPFFRIVNVMSAAPTPTTRFCIVRFRIVPVLRIGILTPVVGATPV
jgi:hypothetical protein